MTTDEILYLQFLITIVGAVVLWSIASPMGRSIASIGALVLTAAAAASILYYWFRQAHAWIQARREEVENA